MGQVISRHDTLLQQQIEAAGGRITKHTGDGVTAAFAAGEPVACALETLKVFARENWGAIGELRIRLGLHAGEAEWLAGFVADSGDYHGPPVNCAARVMSVAWGGQILLTPAVTRVSRLPDRATLLDLGEHLLKNVSAPQHLYQLLHPELPGQDFPPPRSLSGESIKANVGRQGQQFVDLNPTHMAVRLTSALLLPTLQGDLSPSSPTLEGNLGVLQDLGTVVLPELLASFAGQLQAGRQGDQGVAAVQAQPPVLLQQLEAELLSHWQSGGEMGLALRADASRLLQAVDGVDAALAAATTEIKGALTQGLAELGGTFGEFRWMLDGLQETLTDMRVHQALQLALQREQLDLQRQQLVKTNLLLQRQQGGVVLTPAAPLITMQDELEAQPPADVVCPYKGLAAFEPDDAEYFFGREELVAELAARLAGSRFLAVVGPSGSGKSSLVKAGLLPAIWAGALPGSGEWQTLVLTPGPAPLEELAVRLSLLTRFPPGALLNDLEADYRSLHLAITGLLADKPGPVQLLLVVDQFEELFALCHDEGERRQFIDALLCAVEAKTSRTLVVPTIRADFYGHCAEYPDLADRMRDSLLVGPLREEELRQAIERPAALVGLGLEPGLADSIMADVAQEPGGLPLLSHALVETWERRQGLTLTLSGYAASGGVAGAIAQTADTVYEQLSAEQQAIARGVFLRLTEFGEEGTQDTRRRIELAELVGRPEEAPDVEAVLKILADARLVTTGGGQAPSPAGSEAENTALPEGDAASLDGIVGTVEVAHEALIREWPLLRGWLEEDREGLRIHRHLTEAAAEWARLDRDPGELYRGARLAMASEWVATNGERLNPLEREFLEASQAWVQRREAEREARRQRELETERQRAAEQSRASRRLRWLVAGLALVFVLALGAAFYAQGQQQQAQEREAEAVAAQATVVRQSGLITSRHLASQAMGHLAGDPLALDLALLLGIEAVQAEDRAEARSTLLAGLQYSPQLTAFLHGDPDTVTDLAMSPDGQTLAAGSEDGSIILWDTARRERRGEPLRGHDDRVTSLAFGPDGKTLASGSQDKTVVLWDITTGEPLGQPLAGHDDWVTDVAFDPQGQTLASASYDRTVMLWNADSGKALHQPLAGHQDWVLGVAFSPDGRTLASGSRDGTIRLWHVDSGQARGEPLSGHQGWVLDLAYSPDGPVLASGGQDQTVRLWAADSGEPLGPPLTGHEGPVESVTFDPDGRTLASGGHDGTVRLWDGATGDPLSQPLRGHAGWVLGVAFGPDGHTLASGGNDGLVLLWDMAGTGVREQTLAGHDDWVRFVAFDQDGRTLVSGSIDGIIQRWDVESGRTTGPALGVGAVSSLAFSPDTSILASAGRDETLTLWDMVGGERLGQPLAGHATLVTSLAFGPDGGTLASGDVDGTISLWDVESGQQLGQSRLGHGDDVSSLAFSADGATLASAGTDKVIVLWDTASGEALGQPLIGHTAPINTVAFSPDGSILASGGEDSNIILWDLVDGEPLGPPLNGHGDVEALTFSPDGKMLAAGGSDRMIRLWDVSSGQPLGQPLSGHTDWVNSLAFSPDSQMLASGSNDQAVMLWEAGPAAWQVRACGIANRDLTAAEWKGYLGEQAYRETCGSGDQE